MYQQPMSDPFDPSHCRKSISGDHIAKRRDPNALNMLGDSVECSVCGLWFTPEPMPDFGSFHTAGYKQPDFLIDDEPKFKLNEDEPLRGFGDTTLESCPGSRNGKPHDYELGFCDRCGDPELKSWKQRY